MFSENLGTRFGVVCDKNDLKKKTIVNALTVKIESQHISRLCNTSVRLKRQHSILSSNVNKFSIQQTSVSSKGLIVSVFYRQIVISRTRSYSLTGIYSVLLKTRMNNRGNQF